MATKFEILLQATLDKSASDAQIRKDIKELEKSLALNLELKADSKSANQIKNAIAGVGDAAKNAKTHTQGLSDIIGKFTSWQVVGDIIHGVKNGIQDMVQQVTELDASLVELAKTSDLEGEALERFADKAFDAGQKIGATGKDVIDATQIFTQAGYEVDNALELGKWATMLKNVGDANATAEGSANTLIATMKAFKLEAEDAEHVVDALNQVSNKYAVSVSDLSTGITKASASLAATGTTLEETLGLVTAGTEILREPGRVARGLSTIGARLRGVGEDGEALAGLTPKLDDLIKTVTKSEGVIDSQTGELRSTYDILQDLSEHWSELNSLQQQNIAEQVAGKNQIVLFNAIMTNFGSAVGATADAYNSLGSAEEENNKRMDSVQGKLTQLDSAWQKFARDTIDSTVIKSIIGLGTELINFVDRVGGIAPVIGVATAALLIFKGGLVMDKVIKLFVSGLSSMKTGFLNFIYVIPNAIAALKAYNAGIITTSTLMQALAPTLGLVTLAVIGVIMAVNAYTKAQEEATAAAIESSQKSAEIIESKKEEKSKIEDEIKALEEEKKSYIKNKDAKDLNAENDEFIKSKDEEITKRQENIDKINEELKKELEQREAAARSMTTKKADSSKLGLGNLGFSSSSFEEHRKYNSMIYESNERLKEAGENTGAYKRILEELRAEYNKQLKEKEANNESYINEEEIIKNLNKELEDNSDKYEKDSEVADEFYDILLKGGNISQDNIKWLKQFLGLTDEQISKLKEGIDVKNQDIDAINEQDEATANLTEKQKELSEAVEGAQKAFASKNEELDKLQKAYDTLTGAVDEYNSSGVLSIDTLQNLLALDDQYLSLLSLQNGQLVLNTQGIDQLTDALVAKRIETLQAAAIEDIYNLAIGNTEKLSATAKTAINNVGTQAINTGKDFATAVPDIQKFTTALLDAKAAAGADTTTDDFEAKANSIIGSYKNIYNNITKLGAETSRLGKGHSYSGSSSKKKSGSSSKSTKEEYRAEVDALYGYKNALEIAKDSVDKLNDALKNTDNFNEQEKYIRQLIDATNNQINKTNDLKNAQANQINDYINQLRAQGFAIDYNASSNELYIRNMERLGQLSGDNAKAVEKMIDKIQDLNKDNRSLDGSVRDLTADVKDYYDQLADFPEEKLKKFNELMQEFQQSQLDQIQNQIDDINHEMENDPRIKALEKQIEALEEQNDELDKQKELEEKLLAIEEAKIKLQNAQKQRNMMVYREKQGWVKSICPAA